MVVKNCLVLSEVVYGWFLKVICESDLLICFVLGGEVKYFFVFFRWFLFVSEIGDGD